MDVSDVTCFESEVTVRENPVVEQAGHNADIVVPRNDNVTISTDSDIQKGSMSAAQLQ
jgi:flagellar basal body rod protein FlgF